MILTEEFRFFNYLLEEYAAYKDMNAADVLREWDKKGITQEIYDGYWGYHQEAIQNAYMDIDSLMTTGKHAW